jgi:hypothetical protein
MFYRKYDRYDPVQEEIESRRPFFQRTQTRGMIAVLLAMLIWFVAQLFGVDIPFPFHFF